MKNLSDEQLQSIRDVFEARPNYTEVYFDLTGTQWLFRKKPLFPVTVTREEIMNNKKVSGKITDSTEKANEKEVKTDLKDPNSKKK